MTAARNLDAELAGKMLFGDAAGAADDGQTGPRAASPPDRRLETDQDNAADDLVRLVLTLLDTIRQLMERQAIRRVESGSLSDDEVERVGVTLMRLEERMAELKAQFGIDDEHLSFRVGTVQDLLNVLQDEDEGTG